MRKRYLAIAAGVLAVTLTVGGGIAWATSGGDDGQPLSGTTLDRASAAALMYTGAGRVTEAEVGDDGAAYDVGVRRRNGTKVDVRLDSSFHVIGQEREDDGARGEQRGSDDRSGGQDD
jgi:hypothetical protein